MNGRWPELLKGAMAVGTVLVLSGAIVAAWSQRSVKDEFDPGLLVQAGLTILVGVALTQYLSLRISERKGERDIIIRAVGSLLDLLDDVAEALAEPVPQESARKPLKRIGVQLPVLDEMLRRFHLENREAFSREAQAQFIALRCATTDRREPTVETRLAAEKACSGLRKRLAMLVFDINAQ